MNIQVVLFLMIGIPLLFVMAYILSRVITAAYFRSKHQSELSRYSRILKKES